MLKGGVLSALGSRGGKKEQGEINGLGVSGKHPITLGSRGKRTLQKKAIKLRTSIFFLEVRLTLEG